MTASSYPHVVAASVPGLLALHEDEPLPLASVGKVLLLARLARDLAGGVADPASRVELRDDDYCGGSGLLTGLSARVWTVADLALLTASVSDNTATNALIRTVDLDRVNEGAAELGLSHTRLLDRIREPRGPEHPPAFALGTAGELARLATRVGGDETWARILRGWMSANTDRALVPALLPHDPEAEEPDGPLPEGVVWVANKTGTDTGTRTDVGVIVGRRRLGYAVLAHGPAGSEHALVGEVRDLGLDIGALALATD
ncbi:serine hydrolase [Sinosporangium siamense]|uniref:Serine hydrolase n=1 Tax=Sinosporangium siamense TaxID=1367973 RepID=A0A919V5C7_9ACTN|nr:serine hydrolase [Sinosporangium siamense]GII90706.1 serine hydrolase [Sinosporangium siamense]